MKEELFHGVIPAIVTPFREDSDIDEPSLRRFARSLVSVKGVTGLTCNAHIGEGVSLTPLERMNVIRVIREEIGESKLVVAGVFGSSPREALETISNAKEAGADAVLVGPPSIWGIGQSPDVAVKFFADLSSGSALPVVVFQYPEFTGMSYSPGTLARIAGLERVVAVKDAVWDIEKYENDYRALRAARSDLAILPACDSILYGTYLIGADGTLIGYANILPQLFTKLFESAMNGDLDEARRINNGLFHLTQAVWAKPPATRIVSRIKQALVHLGQLEKAVVRSPLDEVGEDEKKALRDAVDEAEALL